MSETISLPSDAEASGRSFGPEELEYLREVLAAGRLFGPHGSFTRRAEECLGEVFGVSHVRMVASGSAAVHTALGALEIEPGDEVVTTPITDMGAILPILYQGAVPIFADVDPLSLNLSAESIEARLSERTRAVIVTHLFGNPVPMEPVKTLADRHGFAVIEDAAQAFLATDRGEPVGTIGHLGAFSMQQGKHMTCGEGGFVVTRDPELGRRVRLFSDKAWPYGEADADHEFLALNYRMSELQAAVALAQAEKLEGNVSRRCQTVALLAAALRDLPGVGFAGDPPGGRHVYWRIPLNVDRQVLRGGADALGAFLKERGIHCAPRYIRKPAFECRVLAEQRTLGASRWPFSAWEARSGRTWRCEPDDFPGTYAGLRDILVLPWNERYEPEHVEAVAGAIREFAMRAVG